MEEQQMFRLKNTSNANFTSNMEIINLHSELNNELERFHQTMNAIKKHTHLDREHLEQEKDKIMHGIQCINEKIQSLVPHRKNK